MLSIFLSLSVYYILKSLQEFPLHLTCSFPFRKIDFQSIFNNFKKIKNKFANQFIFLIHTSAISLAHLRSYSYNFNFNRENKAV